MATPSLNRWCGSGILLAVSGGADSVAMLRCFAAFLALPEVYSNRLEISDTQPVHVAHVNHALRGDESDADALFVRELAATFHLPYHEIRLTAGMFDTDDSGSFEAAARRLRYDFLRKTAEKHALRYVATAHHANDRIETVLHRIIRGTGIAGLAGIPEFRQLGGAVTIVRPMLSFSRQQILEYLQENKRLIEREELLEQLSEAEWQFTQLVSELLNHNGNITIQEFLPEKEKILALRKNSTDRRKTAENLNPLGNNSPASPIVSSDEITELLKAF